MAAGLVTADNIRAAAELLRAVVVRTPLLPVYALTDVFDAPLYVKPEMLQRGGAFKFRGAYNFIASLTDEERNRGVVAPSSGNHGQGVALAAQLFGIKATVVMPTTGTAAKREGAERMGARVIMHGTTTDERYARAEEIVANEGATMVPPYDHPGIIAGQATAGLEIAEDLPDVRTVVVPVGGGGLSAGVATAIKKFAPEARIIGVEPEGAAKLSRAREAGHPVRLGGSTSIADGLLAVEIGHVTFAHHAEYLDDVVTVPDSAMLDGMRFLMNRMKLVSEPSGAITISAVMTGLIPADGPTVVVLSGGNIEWDGLVPLLGV